MGDRLLTDETIKKHIQKYGKEHYVQKVQYQLKEGEEKYLRGKEHLEHILERINVLSKK